MPDSEGLPVDRDYFVNLLCWSVSFSPDEKGRVLEKAGERSSAQVDELVGILEQERQRLMALWTGRPEHREQLLGFYFEFQRQWAILLLGEERAAHRRFLLAPLEGDPLFPHWEKLPDYWLLPGRDLLLRLADRDHAIAALDKAAELTGDPSRLAERLLESLDPKRLSPDLLEAAEDYARRLAPQAPWLRFLMARNRLKGPNPDPDTPRSLVEPLLDDPPDDGRRCAELGALVRKHLPALAPRTEKAQRRAVELAPELAFAWNGLGNLLKDHLARYEEAEAAYRKAIELDPKDAGPWNGLGLLRLYAHRDCAGAAQAYRSGLALPKQATSPCLAMNLGHLLLLQGEAEEAESHLGEALEGFGQEKDNRDNALHLALELNDAQRIQRHLPLARAALESGHAGHAIALLLHAAVQGGEAAEAEKETALAALDDYHGHFELLDGLYLLAGLRPEARENARTLVAELLDPPEALTARFRDRPKPRDWYARYRPFAEGRSRGAGDPADRHLFCA